MKNLSLLIIIAFVIGACGSSKESPDNNSQESNFEIEGIWTEHWEQSNSETDIEYVDTLKFQRKQNGLQINCINDPTYKYADIEYKNEELKFTLENTKDPNEKFFVYYTLKLTPEKKSFKGSIKNSRGITNNVELKLFTKSDSK